MSKKATERLMALVEKSNVVPTHDVLDTLYEVKLKCGVRVMVDADTLHGEMSDAAWSEFLELVEERDAG